MTLRRWLGHQRSGAALPIPASAHAAGLLRFVSFVVLRLAPERLPPTLRRCD
jgi:hypothetical protein